MLNIINENSFNYGTIITSHSKVVNKFKVNFHFLPCIDILKYLQHNVIIVFSFFSWLHFFILFIHFQWIFRAWSRDGANRVECRGCESLTCFSCGGPHHAPTDCPTIKLWLTKCADDSETANYISAHTKVGGKLIHYLDNFINV